MSRFAEALSLEPQPVAGHWREVTIRAYFAISAALATAFGVMGLTLGYRVSTAPLIVSGLYLGFAAVVIGMLFTRVLFDQRVMLMTLLLELACITAAAWVQQYGVSAGTMFIVPTIVCVATGVGTPRTAWTTLVATVGCLSFLVWAVPGQQMPAPGAPSELMRLFSLIGVLALVFVVTRIFARSLNLALNLQESLVGLSPLPIVVVAIAADKVVNANAAYEQVVGMPLAHIRAQRATSLDIFANTAQRDALYAALKAQRRVVGMPLTVTSRQGKVSHILVSAQIMDVDGRRYTVMYGLDQTQQMAQRDEMEQMRIIHDQSLNAALRLAEAGNKAKGEFLANMSHEVRTPLNGIIGLSSIARGPQVSPARRDELLGLMHDSANSLLGLLNDILDLSRIEAGRLELQMADFDVRELLQSLHDAHAPLAEERGLLMLSHCELPEPALVRGDAGRLRQILANLISNALKFTPKGHVRVSCSALGGDRLRFEVEDTGSGISAEQQSRLFRNFVQVDASSTRARGGSGLGLAICRQLAQLMGGDVGVSSRLGQGSRFVVEVQLQPPRGESAAEASTLTLSDYSGRLAGVRVLTVEDSPINMAITVHLLSMMGAEVLQATDGELACRVVQQHLQRRERIDLILMDLHMPTMDGFEATRMIRAMDGGEQIAIIALTASALLDQQDQALEAGMDAFLTKPVRPGVLCDAVQTHVLKQRQHRLPNADRSQSAANDVQIENA